MSGENPYRNVLVDVGGKSYRVAFHVGLRKPMIVCLQRMGKPGRWSRPATERALKIEGKTAKRVIAAALPLLEGLAP